MDGKIVLGIDFGTDSVRCLVVDTSNGREVSSAVAEYPRWKSQLYCNPSIGQYRQHPLDYTESLTRCVREALAKAGPGSAEFVCGLSFDTTASTPALVDGSGTPLAQIGRAHV